MKPIITNQYKGRLGALASKLTDYSVPKAGGIVTSLDKFLNKNSLFGLLDFYIYSMPPGVGLVMVAYYNKLGVDTTEPLRKVRTRVDTSCAVLSTLNKDIQDFDDFVMNKLDYPKLEYNPFNVDTLLDWRPEPRYSNMQQYLKEGNLPELFHQLIGIKTGFNIKHWPNKYKELAVLLHSAYGKFVLGSNLHQHLVVN